MSNNLDEINFDNLDEIEEFNTYKNEDKKQNFISKRKKIIKGTDKEKTFRPGIKFTEENKKEFSKLKMTLGVNTINAVLYKLIDMGKEQHLKDINDILNQKIGGKIN